ncbi:MAG: TolC family protein [Rickettsiales bacterium]|nr:TolC family protein [Rickettsiales bacterium]
MLILLLFACAPNLPENKNGAGNLKIPADFSKNFSEKNSENENPQSQQNKEETAKEENFGTKNWQVFFKDEELKSLIEIALKNNQELNILDQEIIIKSNEVLARQGQYLPKIGVGADLAKEKTSQYSSQGAADKNSNLPETLNNRQLALTASWEVDIWGKLRNFKKSAYLEYLASIEGKNFAVTQLIAEIANDYYELMSLDNQLEIIEQYIVTLEKAQQVVALQKIAGRTTSLAVRRFDAEVLKNQSREYKIKQQIIVTENHLNKILGRLPQTILRPSNKFKEITIDEIAVGIPAALLDNRPDVKQAALKIAAAKLNIKAVKAQFYPSLNIDGSLGYQSFNSRHFVNPESLFFNAAAGLTAPLLNRNAIKADYFSANSRQIEAIYNYEKTFITAFAEVSNQLAAVKNLDQIYKLKSKQAEALADSFDISNILFLAARVDYLESLLTRRDYLEAQTELVEVKQQQLSAYVNLYKALGGGWRSELPQVNKKQALIQ